MQNCWGGGLILCFSLSSLISIGFGSYLIGTSTEVGPVVIEAGDVVEVLPNYGNAISFVIGSESGIGYYTTGYGNGTPEITDSSYEIRLRINPSRMDENFDLYGNNNVFATLGISYSTDSGFNFFDGSICVVPETVSFVLEGKDSAAIDFPLTYEMTQETDGNVSYQLKSNFLVYSKEEVSLYSFFRHYQKSSENLYLSARFTFDMGGLSAYQLSEILKTPIHFVTTLSGVVS